MEEYAIKGISPLSEEVIFELRWKHKLWSSGKSGWGEKEYCTKRE